RRRACDPFVARHDLAGTCERVDLPRRESGLESARRAKARRDLFDDRPWMNGQSPRKRVTQSYRAPPGVRRRAASCQARTDRGPLGGPSIPPFFGAAKRGGPSSGEGGTRRVLEGGSREEDPGRR